MKNLIIIPLFLLCNCLTHTSPECELEPDTLVCAVGQLHFIMGGREATIQPEHLLGEYLVVDSVNEYIYLRILSTNFEFTVLLECCDSLEVI